jgi:hypothetical protein
MDRARLGGKHEIADHQALRQVRLEPAVFLLLKEKRS